MTAVTPRLWVGECHFEHTSCKTAKQAVDALHMGATVVVPDFETAAEALGLFGSPTGEIAYRIADARRREATGMKD